MTKKNYLFTNDWFDSNIGVWDQLIDSVNPTKILEVGSYEGKSTTFLIEKLTAKKDIEIHCIDNWKGGIEHQSGGAYQTEMSEVEKRFHNNLNTAKSNQNFSANINIHKGSSHSELPKLVAEGKSEYFDFIYIDGSHQAPDVLLDAVIAFILLKKNGVIAFDDYLWEEPLPGGADPIRSPKIAIDAFTNIFCRKLNILRAPLNQLYIQKTNS